MSLSSELIEQAEMLVRREPKHPKQASLRRATSTAYYSLFHFLLDEAVVRFSTTPSLQHLLRRAFQHTEMAKVANTLRARGPLPGHVESLNIPIPDEIRDISAAFVTLQQARHDADYNLAKQFNRSEVEGWITKVRDAFDGWRTLLSTASSLPAVELFLTGLLLWDRWGKR